MAKKNILDIMKQNTADFKDSLKDQKETLQKLQKIGKDLGELTEEADPFDEIIGGTLETVSSMEKLIDKLEKIETPEL